MGVAKNTLRNHFEAILYYAHGAGRELRILGRPMENFLNETPGSSSHVVLVLIMSF